MTGWQFIIGSLLHYRRINIAVALGVAAATAVLTGALLVGDSVVASLRRLVLDGLGQIDEVLLADRFFRADLAEELRSAPTFPPRFAAAIPAILYPRATLERTAPAIAAAAPAERSPSPVARASQVTVIGAPPTFWDAGDGRARPRILPGEGEVVLNAPLAEDLGAQVGDEVVLRLPKSQQVPADSPLGRRTDRTISVAGLKIVDIVPAESLGRFSLQTNQVTPRNAYVATATLDRALGQPGRVNAILVTGPKTSAPPDRAAEQALAQSLRPSLADYGLALRRIRRTFPADSQSADAIVYDYFSLTTDRLMFSPAAEEAARQALAEEHAQPILTYLATSIAAVGSDTNESTAIPYSLVTAVDSCPPLGPLTTASAASGTPLADDEIVLNRWAADDLRVTPGARVRVTFFEPETSHGALHERTAEFQVRAVVPLTEPNVPARGQRPARFDHRPVWANDPDLTPTVAGVTDQDSISKWEAPFPVDYSRVRRQDDAYWQNHRTTPKAFLSLAAGQKLWASRFGRITSYRIPAPAGLAPGSAAEQRFVQRLEDRLRAQLDTQRAALGLVFLPVKARGLMAASGNTPFGVLFLFLSMFVIAAALLLVALLFRLGVERRATEIGTLLAVGLERGRVGRWLMAEGSLVAAAGGMLGVAAGVAYAWLMLAGLRTWWFGAVQTTALGLSVAPSSLVIGYASGVCVGLATIAGSLHGARHIAVRRWLAGQVTAEGDGTGTAGRWSAWAACGLFAAAVGLAIGATRWGGEAQAGAFVGSGTLVLAAGLIAVRRRLKSRGLLGGQPARLQLLSLAVQNATRNPGRSTATIGLVAVACFLIVAMSAFRLEPSAAGTGGFDLIAESTEPIFENLNRQDVRQDLLADDARLLTGSTIIGFRMQPGDDASCNNLYRAAQPRVLGVTEDLMGDRDGTDRPSFAWAASAAKTDLDQANPWRLLSPEHPDARGQGPSPTGPSPGANHQDAAPPPAVPVILDQNTARYSLQLYGGIGEEFSVTYGDGPAVRFRVVGLLANSILQGSLLVSEQDFLRLFPSVSGYQFFLIRVAPGGVLPRPAPEPDVARQQRTPGEAGGRLADPAARGSAAKIQRVAEVLEGRLSDQGFDATSAYGRLADLLAVQNTYLSTFQSLGALGLLLGTFGLAAVQARNVLERRRELALLRAVGFRWARVSRLVMLENVGLLVIGLATGGGAALVTVLPHLLTGGAAVPWRALAVMLATVLLAGIGSSFATVRTALRGPMLAALRGD